MHSCGGTVVYLHQVNGTVTLRSELVRCPSTQYVTSAFLGVLSVLGTALNLLLLLTVLGTQHGAPLAAGRADRQLGRLPCALSVCLLAGSPLTLPREGRCGCGAAGIDQPTTAYAVVSLVVGHLVPCVGALVCVLQVAAVLRRERRHLLRLRRRGGPADTWQLFAAPRLQAEQQPTVTVLVLTALYLLLCMPYTVMVHLEAAMGRSNTTAAADTTVKLQWEGESDYELAVLDNSELLTVAAHRGQRRLTSRLTACRCPGPLRLRVELLLLRWRAGSGRSLLQSAPAERTARGSRPGQVRSTSSRTPVLFATEARSAAEETGRPAPPRSAGRPAPAGWAPRQLLTSMSCCFDLCDVDLAEGHGETSSRPGHEAGGAGQSAPPPRTDSGNTVGTDSGVEMDSAEMKITDLEDSDPPWWRAITRHRPRQGRRVRFADEGRSEERSPAASMPTNTVFFQNWG
ncbi:hypothetical protein FJT64_026839 [Amphibalanus amphitrite]|uniref:G-protein coupled receptors family 1 profile domain-containing protein n=1 Tax=Amphibalanus amphitrite TaxID=1232801 RepID=A0A6A4WFF3_AMPAM|nr:hypothetical protein FJT64_026839 [Amphibalanus amphitrite]